MNISYEQFCNTCGGVIVYTIVDNGEQIPETTLEKEYSCACVQDWALDEQCEREMNSGMDWVAEQEPQP